MSEAKAYLVFHPHYVKYAALKYRRYQTLGEELPSKSGDIDAQEYDDACDEWRAEGIASILFCALALESMGYHICHEWWGEEVAIRKFGRCSPAQRWVDALQERYGVTFDTEGDIYRKLFETFNVRNQLAHKRSVSNTSDLSTILAVSAFRPSWVEDAIAALRRVPAEAARLTGDVIFVQEAGQIETLFARLTKARV